MTKTALSATLMASLLGSTVPPAAQDRMDSAVRPLAQAVAREAIRLAAAPEPAMSVAEAAQRGGKSADSDWSRVRKLAPGKEVVVTVKDSQSGKRFVLSADESAITVLNLADPVLPAVAKTTLRGWASHHPEYFAALDSGTFMESGVALGRDGISVAGRKVADLAQIVENDAKIDAVEIRGRPAERTGWQGLSGGQKGALIGLAIGGALAAASAGSCYGHDVPCGAIAAGGIGFYTGIGALIGMSTNRPDLIYRAP